MRELPLRRATSADAEALRALTRAAYAEWVPLIGREPRPMTADYDRAVNDHMVDLYEERGQLVALVETIPNPSHLTIENIAVRPDRRGEGIGEVLLKHAETIARSRNLGALRLYTNAVFASNIDFYAKRGFVEFKREPLEAGGEIVHMKKVLEP